MTDNGKEIKVGLSLEAEENEAIIGEAEYECDVNRSGLYQVYDHVARVFSPVFEQSSDEAAKRVFRLKTMKEVPAEAEKADWLLFRVGTRKGYMIEGDFALLARGEIEL